MDTRKKWQKASKINSMKIIYMQRTIEMIVKNEIKLSADSLLNTKPTRVETHKEQNYLVYEFDNKEL